MLQNQLLPGLSPRCRWGVYSALPDQWCSSGMGRWAKSRAPECRGPRVQDKFLIIVTVIVRISGNRLDSLALISIEKK